MSPLISKNSLLKPALPEESIAMSFRRDETGLSATREGAIEHPKYRAAMQYLRQLRKAEGGLRGMNTAQAGDSVENLGQ